MPAASRSAPSFAVVAPDASRPAPSTASPRLSRTSASPTRSDSAACLPTRSATAVRIVLPACSAMVDARYELVSAVVIVSFACSGSSDCAETSEDEKSCGIVTTKSYVPFRTPDRASAAEVSVHLKSWPSIASFVTSLP